MARGPPPATPPRRARVPSSDVRPPTDRTAPVARQQRLGPRIITGLLGPPRFGQLGGRPPVERRPGRLRRLWPLRREGPRHRNGGLLLLLLLGLPLPLKSLEAAGRERSGRVGRRHSRCQLSRWREFDRHGRRLGFALLLRRRGRRGRRGLPRLVRKERRHRRRRRLRRPRRGDGDDCCAVAPDYDATRARARRLLNSTRSRRRVRRPRYMNFRLEPRLLGGGAGRRQAKGVEHFDLLGRPYDGHEPDLLVRRRGREPHQAQEGHGRREARPRRDDQQRSAARRLPGLLLQGQGRDERAPDLELEDGLPRRQAAQGARPPARVEDVDDRGAVRRAGDREGVPHPRDVAAPEPHDAARELFLGVARHGDQDRRHRRVARRGDGAARGPLGDASTRRIGGDEDDGGRGEREDPGPVEHHKKPPGPVQLVRDHEQRVGPPPHRVQTRHADDDADAPRQQAVEVRDVPRGRLGAAGAGEELGRPVRHARRPVARAQGLVSNFFEPALEAPDEEVEGDVQRRQDQRGSPQNAVEGHRGLVAEAERSQRRRELLGRHAQQRHGHHGVPAELVGVPLERVVALRPIGMPRPDGFPARARREDVQRHDSNENERERY
mmetsp:Transcript_12092/g.31867  ORF Transcript_12092/g.31867 Transcript_12092/m.31867 type:complete len:609 (-) Transcript_12092:413-2239(-)